MRQILLDISSHSVSIVSRTLSMRPATVSPRIQSPGSNDTNPEELRWLIQAAAELVEELHVKPKSGLEWLRTVGDGTLLSERHPDPAEATIRFAIREIRYSQPKGTVQRHEAG